NIGARRLYTVVEKVVEALSFDAPDLAESDRRVSIDAAYVRERLKSIVEDEDLAKYIL
ncbi:MAG: HslU--HslV peptidase ATPase subunit, partial [Planctomycetota bacterium]|nr:HslU--HslV peptidase ATPase subunit [Planctomycetota bacterium]